MTPFKARVAAVHIENHEVVLSVFDGEWRTVALVPGEARVLAEILVAAADVAQSSWWESDEGKRRKAENEAWGKGRLEP